MSINGTNRYVVIFGGRLKSTIVFLIFFALLLLALELKNSLSLGK